ncbi:hypothetical protein RJZ56_002579 [Blastomyces dermatitidis]
MINQNIRTTGKLESDLGKQIEHSCLALINHKLNSTGAVRLITSYPLLALERIEDAFSNSFASGVFFGIDDDLSEYFMRVFVGSFPDASVLRILIFLKDDFEFSIDLRSFDGCESAEITTDITESMREYGRRKFVFGPLALREFWEKERSQMSIDREPWKSIKAYLESIALREISWTGKYASSSAKAPGYLKLSEAQRSPEEHIQLLNKYLDAISAVIPSNPYVIRPTIYHPDLHSGNIFIHNGRISSRN